MMFTSSFWISLKKMKDMRNIIICTWKFMKQHSSWFWWYFIFVLSSVNRFLVICVSLLMGFETFELVEKLYVDNSRWLLHLFPWACFIFIQYYKAFSTDWSIMYLSSVGHVRVTVFYSVVVLRAVYFKLASVMLCSSFHGYVSISIISQI